MRDLANLDAPTTQPVRRIRRAYSDELQDESPESIVAVAIQIAERCPERTRWVGYELVYYHPGGIESLDISDVETLGRGLDGWIAVDTFARYVSGPAWRLGRIEDGDVRRWARSEDRYWRRAALVSTVPLNLRAAGGSGDTRRTLDICAMLVDDRDDTIVKALSWALRQLVIWDPAAVEVFLDRYDPRLAARVKRETRNKLTTGKKT